MEVFMKMQMSYYLRKLQEIQMKLAEEGKRSQVSSSFGNDELWTIDFSADGGGLTVFYIWSNRLRNVSDETENERKLNELTNRYVYKALMVVA